MRLTFVTGHLSDGGGVNRVISELSAVLAEQPGFEVSLLPIGPAETSSYPISHRVKLDSGRGGGGIRWPEALSRLRREKPDFVIGTWTQSNLMLIAGLLFSGIRVIAVENSSWAYQPRRIRALRRLIYPLAWRVIAINPSDYAHYRRFSRNVRLVPNPVSAPPYRPDEQREKLVLAIGHLIPNKNFSDAIEAMARSGLGHQGWRLTIVGAGPEEQRLREMIRKAGLGETRIVPPTNDLAALYARASLLLVPSRSEAFSLVLAEAMSAGVVPLAYATPGPAFILEDFPEQLVELGDVAVLAERLRSLAQGGVPNSLRAELSGSIQSRFSPTIITRQWLALLNEPDARGVD